MDTTKPVQDIRHADLITNRGGSFVQEDSIQDEKPNVTNSPHSYKVAILGAGGIGLGMAALLSRDGHLPVIWSPSGPNGAKNSVKATGVIEGEYPARYASSCAEAVSGVDVILITVPGSGHRAVMDACAPHLIDGQTVIISSHMSLSALYLLKQLHKCQPTATVQVVAWGTTLTTGRRLGPGSVQVLNIRHQLDLTASAESNINVSQAMNLCQSLFGNRFVDRGSLTAIALSNLNPQNHMAIALCNLTRMEKGEPWKQWSNTTHAVGRLMQGLDDERVAIAHAYGVSVRTIAEHLRLSFGAEGATVGDMVASLAGDAVEPNGPTTLEARYVLEDIPFGLWPTVCLARLVNVPVPLHEAGIHIFSALYGRDFVAENDILPALEPLQASLKDMI